MSLNAEVRLLLSDVEVVVEPQRVFFHKDDGTSFLFLPETWARILRDFAHGRLADADTDVANVDGAVVRLVSGEDTDEDTVELWWDGQFVSGLDLRSWRLVTDVTSAVLGLNGR